MMRNLRRLDSLRLLVNVTRLVLLMGGSCHLCWAGSACDNRACDVTISSAQCPRKNNLSVNKICSTPLLPPALPAPLVKFTNEPSNVLYTSSTLASSSVSINCSISATLPSDVSINFQWERNGAIIDFTQGGIHSVHSADALSSTLTITNRTEGVYRCRVARQVIGEEGRYDVVSRAATLSIPTLNGWLDTVNTVSLAQRPINSNNQHINLKVPLGGSTVLECNPNITDPSTPSITWLRNNIPLNNSDEYHTILPQSHSLILHSFSLPLGSDVVTYRCFLDGFEFYEEEIEREFQITMAGEGDKEFGQKFSAVPHTQSVVVGGNVTMYCITNNHTSSFPVKWYKDDVILSNRFTILGDSNEVLFIQNVTLEDAGDYGCIAPSGKNMTALLTVLAPPTQATISVSNYTITDGQLRLPNTTSAISMMMTCDTDVTNGIEYEWFFRGERLRGHNFTSKNLSYHSEGNVLYLAGTVEGVTGSVQCFARNVDMAGSSHSVSSSLQIVELYMTNKPLPPSRVSYELHSQWVYRIHFSPPTNLAGPFHSSNISYNIEAYVDTSDSQTNYDYCMTCGHVANFDDQTGHGIFDLNTVQFMDSGARLVRMYVRVAISVNGVLSDFVSLSNNCEDGINLTLRDPPPAPSIKSMSQDPDSGNVTLMWDKVDECDYPMEHHSVQVFDTSVHMMCGDGLDETVSILGKTQYSVTHHVSGCVLCNWTVTYTVPNSSPSLTSSTSNTINTRSLLHAPVLHSPVYDGQSIHFNATFLSSDLTCSNNIIVNSSLTNLHQFGFNESCHLLLPQTQGTKTYSCVVSYALDDCGGEHNISVALNFQGPFSDGRAIQFPSIADISRLQKFVDNSTTSSSVSISYRLGNNLSCLLQHDEEAAAKICCAEKVNCDCSVQSLSRCEPHIPRDCRTVDKRMASSNITLDGLKANTTYCVMTQVIAGSDVKWMGNSLTIETDEALPTHQSHTSHDDSGEETINPSTKGVTNTMVMALSIGVPSGIVILVVVLVIMAVVIYRCCGRYRTKNDLEDRRRLLHHRDDGEIDDDEDDLVPPNDPAPSECSDGTILNGIYNRNTMVNYLRDVEHYRAVVQGSEEEDAGLDDRITEETQEAAHSPVGGAAGAQVSNLSRKSNSFDQINHFVNDQRQSVTPNVVLVTVELENLNENEPGREEEPLISRDQKESTMEEQSSLGNHTLHKTLESVPTDSQSSSASNSSGYIGVSDPTHPDHTQIKSWPASVVPDNPVALERVSPSTSFIPPLSSGYVQDPDQEASVADQASLPITSHNVNSLCPKKQEYLQGAQPPLGVTVAPSLHQTTSGSDYIHAEEPNNFHAPSTNSSSSYLHTSSPFQPLDDTSLGHTPNFMNGHDTSSYIAAGDAANQGTAAAGTGQNSSKGASGNDFVLGFEEEYDDSSSDSGSQSNSVFADEEGSRFPTRTNQDKSSFSRTRSEVTSGIGSTSSDSLEPSDVVSDYVSDTHSSSETDESNFTFHTQFPRFPYTKDSTLDNDQSNCGYVCSGTPLSSQSTELFHSQLRRQSEGYQSGLPTPVDETAFKFSQEPSFTKQHPLNLPIPLVPQGDLNTRLCSPDPLQTPLSGGGDGSSSGYVSESITSRPSILSDYHSESTPLAMEEESRMLEASFDRETSETVTSSSDDDRQSSYIKFEFPSGNHSSYYPSSECSNASNNTSNGVGDLYQTESQRCNGGTMNTSGIDVGKINFQFNAHSSYMYNTQGYIHS